MIKLVQKAYIRDKKFLLWGLIWAIAVSLYCQAPLIRDKYVVSDDVRQEIFWMAHLRDNALFDRDIHLAYSSWIATPIFKVLYWFSSFFVDPIFMTKILPVLFTAILGFYSYKLGECLRGKMCGLLSSCIVVLVAWYRDFIWFEDAAAASFHPILLIAFLCYFIKKEFNKALLTSILAILSYPPTFLIIVGIWGMSFINVESRKRKLKYLIALAIIGLSWFFIRYDYGSTGFGPPFERKEMVNMPEYYPTQFNGDEMIRFKGRMPMFYPSFWQKVANERTGLGIDHSMVFLIFIAVLLKIFLRRRLTLKPEIWNLTLVSLLLFIFANILLLRLFEPSRYIKIPLSIFLCLFISTGLAELWKSTAKEI